MQESYENDRVKMKQYIWALSFMRPYKNGVILLCTCGFIAAICELMIPKFVQHFLDVTYPAKDHSEFVIGIFLILLVLAFKFGASSGKEIFQRMIQENTARDLQLSIFQQLRRLGFSYYENTSAGAILTLLNTEVSALQKLYRQYFPELLQNTIFTCISFMLMFSLSFSLTLMFLPCFLLYYLVGPYFEKRASWTAQKLANSQREFGQKAYESISALTELRASFSQMWDSQRVLHATDQVNQFFVMRYWYAYWRGTIRRLSYYIGCIILFVYGFYAISNQILTVGEFVAYLLYYFNALLRLTSLITLITEQKVLMYQVKNLYEFMHATPVVAERSDPYAPDTVYGQITLQDVHFSYPGKKPVLKGVTLTIRAGEKVAIVGKSGCGKSTFVKLIGRFYDPDQGQVFLDSVPVSDYSFATLRTAMSIVFQDVYLFGSSIRENIQFARPDATEDEIRAAASAAQLHEMIMNLPEGYETLVGERGVKLSGGQKQRLSLARMFLRRTPIVILDEPTSALDNVSERLVLQAFQDKLKHATIITIAHRLSTIRNYDRIVVMDDGTVAETGTYDELMDHKGVFYQLAKEDASQEVIHA
ncbi:UNVERIFIED_CONTAM: ATP-binding cassette subfamily B protein [Brevibacillus sp. OAP136]